MAHILVVDDDLIYLDELSGGLRSLGHDVASAASSNEALNALKNGTFDITICDTIMAGGGALSLLHEVRALGLKLPFVVITGRPEIATSPLFQSGMREADAKIQKSASLYQINQLIRDLLK